MKGREENQDQLPVGHKDSGCDRESICIEEVAPSKYHSFIHSTNNREDH